MTTATSPTGRTVNLYTAQYPRMWEANGPKCERVQHRSGGRISLYCCRPAGHDRTHGAHPTHLYDVHPTQQRGPLGDAARAARELSNVARYGDEATRSAKLNELTEELSNAAAESQELSRAITSLKAAGADDLVTIVRVRLDRAIARREAASGKLIAYRTNLQGRDHKLANK